MSAIMDLDSLRLNSIMEEQTDPSFLRTSFFSESATPADSAAQDIPCDFVSVLAAAQRLQIDFLPITWQAARGAVGVGGSSRTQQALINQQTSFVFKCVKEVQKDPMRERGTLQVIITEINIHGHPLIREHPNVARLEGICWDISADDMVWPVLVFQKSHLGDLHNFVKRSLCVETRLKLCIDIAVAIRDIHSKGTKSKEIFYPMTDLATGLIHGDIKPQNILVFENQPDIYAAKLADFGAIIHIGREKTLVKMPKSSPWNAPEHHDRWFQLPEAMKMDVYSFGMLCLRLIFEERSFDIASLPAEAPGDEDFLQYHEAWKQGILLEKWKMEDKLPALASWLIRGETRFDNKIRDALSLFFSLTLRQDPNQREADVNALLRLLCPDQ